MDRFGQCNISSGKVKTGAKLTMTARSNSIKMLRIEQVEEKVGFKKSTIFEWMNPVSPRHKPHFPRPRKNGRSNRWYESEIDDFCIVEFGDINSHLTAERGDAVNDRGEVDVIPALTQRAAIKTAGKSAASVCKSTPAIADIFERVASIAQNSEHLRSEVADVREQEIAGVVIDAAKIVAAHSLPSAGLIVDAPNAKPNMSNDGMPPALVDHTSASLFPSVPTTNESSAIKQTDANSNTRVIKVVVAKKRTFRAAPLIRPKTT